MFNPEERTSRSDSMKLTGIQVRIVGKDLEFNFPSHERIRA
jgi:hypothetical protein